jgi:RHS repeat-associated protein
VVSLDSGATVFEATYDASGLRTSKSDSYENATHDYTWGPSGIVHDSANGGTNFTPGLAERRGTTDKFVHGDWLGSTRYLSDSTGNNTPNALRFDGYGRLSASQGGVHPTEFQWAGGWGYQREWSSESDPGLGLDYLQQRYYDPAVGRFLTPDPIGFAGGFNLYAYVENNPVGLVDPSGLSATWVSPTSASGADTAGAYAEGARHLWKWVKQLPDTRFGQYLNEIGPGLYFGVVLRGARTRAPVRGGALRLGKTTCGITPLGRAGFVRFQGREVRAVRDLSHMSVSDLRAMREKGFAAHDINGRPLVVHHNFQKPEGPFTEIPAHKHGIGNTVQHPFGNDKGVGLTDAERTEFKAWRTAYWKARAAAELCRRGLQ